MSNRPIISVVPEELYHVISCAASQDPAQVTTSAARLKDLLDMNGTLNCLSEIAIRRDVLPAIRQQSIIQLKNSVIGHWRSKRLVSDEQKTMIRSRCLTLLDEENDVIADCNKQIIAKIARQDFPNLWPDLLRDLLSRIDAAFGSFVSSQGSDTRAFNVLRRSFDALNSILKEFASIRMPVGLKTMEKLVENLRLTIQNYYSVLSSDFSSLSTPANISSHSAANYLQLSHLSYKCMGKMAIWTWCRLGLNHCLELRTWLEEFFANSVVQLKSLSELRMTLFMSLSPPGQLNLDPFASSSITFLTKHLLQFGKLFRRMQQLFSAKFASLGDCGSLVWFYWNNVIQAANSPPDLIVDSYTAVFPVRYLVQAMIVFKDSLGQWSLTKRGPDPSATFSKEFVEDAVRLLLDRFIPLNPKDLDTWSTDPEEWFNLEDRENDHWEYELRPCGERVLTALANQYKDYVAPLIDAKFRHVMATPTVDLESIVKKESLYCAIGRCAIRLKDIIPFQEWVAIHLTQEARDTNPNFPIIKRRIAWVLGKWISDECSPPTAQIWDILVHLMSDRSQGTDTVVRFTAAASLKGCLDSLQFDVETFEPFLPIVVKRLIELLADADTLEAKTRITQSLNALIEKVELRIIPFMEAIAQPLPELCIYWNFDLSRSCSALTAVAGTAAGSDFMYKLALLDTVTKLTESTKEHSQILNPIIVPLLRESFSEEFRSQLDEAGIKLWKAALQNASSLETSASPSPLDVFPIAIDMLAENLDLLGSTTSIVQSYIILDAAKILQLFGMRLFSALYKALSQALQTNQKGILNLLRLITQLAPSQLWAEPMHASGLFTTFVTTVLEDKAQTILLTDHIFLFARICLQDADLFLKLVAASALSTSKPEPELWVAILDQWWRRFDNISEPRHRKLVAMGIACLVATGKHEVLERLTGEIFNMWLDVFGEMKEALAEISEGGEQSTLSPLVAFWNDEGSTLPSALDDTEGTPEYERWKQIYKHDPVEVTKLTSFVGQRIQAANALYGAEFERRYLQNADPAVLRQLERELTS